MSTNKINIFPPIVNSFISAFTDTADEIKINFALPITTDYKEIKHIDIRMVQQSNNKTVVDTSIYPDGIIYKSKNNVNQNGDIYSINVSRNEVKKIFTTKVEENAAIEKNGWTANTYYKIQIRFGYGELYNDISSFQQWKVNQKNLNNFSEWSNVIVTKAIEKPIVKISNNYDLNDLYSTFKMIPILNTNAENSRFPTFKGEYSSKNSNEPLDKYRFRLYEGIYDNSNYINPYLTSEWITYNNEGQDGISSYVQHTFNQPLNIIEPKYYTVIFDIITKNQYEDSSEPYIFTVNEGILNKITHLDLIVKDNNNNNYYSERLMAPTKNVFNAYKKLFGKLSKDSIYLKKDGTDIYYLKNSNSRIFKKEIPNDLQEKFILNKINIAGLGISQDVLNNSKNKIFLFLNKFNSNNEIEEYNISLSYNEDYTLVDNHLVFNKPIYNVRDGSVYYVQDKDIGILTLQERMETAKSLGQNVRCDENGTLEIYLKNNPYFVETEKYDDINGFNAYDLVEKYQSLDGTYYLIRSDEKSNFTIWEDLAKFEFYDEKSFDNELKILYEDFTVESGVNYKYALQKASIAGYRSPPKFEFNSLESSPVHCSNFQYTYIYAHGIQVRLDLDVKIQQFKHTRLFQKQDSLNSKYPVILRNGLANYGEFSLGGKITLHSDSDGSFFMRNPAEETYDITTGSWKGGYKFNDSIVISPDKYMDTASRFKYYSSQTIDGQDIQIINNQSNINSNIDGQSIDYETNAINNIYEGINLDNHNDVIVRPIFKSAESKNYSMFNTDHTNNNVYMERIYRKYVEEFLNDGNYKLYKSPTEGNMIITLVNVSLTPNQQLNRLISDFSSTAYEVAENTVSNIKLYDINPLDVITNNMAINVQRAGKYKTVAGQIRGVYDGKYNKYIVISKRIYNNLIENNKLKAFEPEKYFKKEENKEEYYTYKKLPVEIINFIEKEKRYEILDSNIANSSSSEEFFNSQKIKIENDYEEIVNNFLNNSNEKKLIEKAKNIELSQLEQDKIKINPYPFNFVLRNNEFWDSKYDDLVDWIKLQEEVNISDERKYHLNNITSITIELYPKHDIEQEILNLKQQTYDTKVNKLAKQLLLAQYELLLEQYELSQSNPIILIINNEKELTVIPGRTYHLEDQNINSLHLKYSRPVLVNYTCVLEEKDNKKNQILARQEMMNIGQVSGVFTDNEKIINAYLYETNEQYNTIGRNIIKDLKNSKMNYNFYDSLNILDVIREQVKQKIDGFISIKSYNDLEEQIDKYFAAINNNEYTFEQQIQEAKKIFSSSIDILKIEKNENTDFWLVNKKYLIYRFEGLESLEIEADANTEIKFNTRDYYQTLGGVLLESDENESKSIIGKTNKFILKLDNTDKNNELEYINDCRFAQPTYALVNYKAIISLEVRGGIE